MDSQKVDMFMMTNAKYFESHQANSIRETLLNLEDESKWNTLQATSFKDPTTALIISLIAGLFGIDRFFLGDVGLGVAKLLTCGGLYVWAVVDWFMIMGKAREKNMEKFNQVVNM